jgi:hypothetical protein
VLAQAGEPLCVDLDATLVTTHSEKDGAAGTYKGTFGYHPDLAFVDRGDGTGEALAAPPTRTPTRSPTAVLCCQHRDMPGPEPGPQARTDSHTTARPPPDHQQHSPTPAQQGCQHPRE